MSTSVEFLQEMKSIIDGLEDDAEAQVRTIAQNVYDALLDTSPVFSAYYKSNHRIRVRGSRGQFRGGGAVLVPAARGDPERFEYLDNVGATRSQELAKMDGFTLGDTVLLFSSVPYADEIEVRVGVYSFASNVADDLARGV